VEVKNEFFKANPNKNVLIDVQGKSFARNAIKTHFVKPKEDYIEIIKQYGSPIYQKGDILSISEKIIALCQDRIVYKSNIKLSFWAKFLSKFVKITPAGEAVGNPYKMQLAIESAGLIRILFAAACAAVTKLFGIKGVFYKIAGNGIAGIDGFCDDAFEDYLEMGIFNPENPDGVCEEIKENLGVECMIVDANDLNVEILGKSSEIQYDVENLKAMIKDNPSGQANQQTPLILIREIESDTELMLAVTEKLE
jgi:F420-0:gamma-glutamyl ligase